MQTKKIEYSDIGVLITLDTPDKFNIIMETLTRCGVASKKAKTLFQSCHILHSRGEYRIVHFLELFMLDGKCSVLSDDDLRRRNAIARLLERWRLCKIVDPASAELINPMDDIRVVPFREKSEWSLCTKYTIGKPKNEQKNKSTDS